MKRLQKFLVLFLILFLISCAATPDIHLRIPGTDMELTRQAQLAMRLAVSPKNSLVMVGSTYHSFNLWDLSTGQMLKSFKMSSSFVGSAYWVEVYFFPNDSTKALSSRTTINIWDIETGSELKEISKFVGDVAISPDGKSALVVGPDSATALHLLDLNTGKIIKKLKGHSDSGWRGTIYSVDISPNGKYGISSSFDKTARIWDLETGQELRRLIGHEGTFREGMVNYVKFSPDGRHVLSGGSDKTLRLWDVETGKLIRTFRGHTDVIYAVAFSSDGKLALSGSWDSTVRLWDVSTGETLKVFKGHAEGHKSAFDPGVYRVKFTPDDGYALSVGDASMRIWDITTGQEIAMMVSFEDGEWLAITPEGYYNSSPNGHKYLRLLMGEKAYSMEQFYDVFYRPDIVAAKLGGEDIKGLATITMNDAIKNPPPIVEITSKLSDSDQPRVKVCYQAKSAGGGIGEMRLFHNGKLIQSDGYYREVAKSAVEKIQLASLDSKAIYKDMRSVSIKGKVDAMPTASKSKGDTFEDCKEIDPIPGENEVSVTAFNRTNTVQSYMKTASFNSKLKQEDPHLTILAVGIDQYTDTNVNLKYAVKDAKDLEEKLKTQSATLYKPENIHYVLLTDREATKTNIVTKVNELSNTIKPQDSFILFVAGHGVLLQNQYYMLTHDYDGMVNDNSMISSNEIVEMSKKIKSLNQLFIFDTCHAGGMDTIVSGLYDARMSVLAKKMGLHIYASASDKQAAMDGYKGNGLFTYTLLDGLNNNKEADRNKDGKVTVVGLGDYSKKKTTNISKEIGHSQTPLIINFGRDNPIYQLK
jgi:WD40 repeat protein